MKEVHAISSDFEKDKIDCNNINLNLNGLDVDEIPEPLRNILQSQAETEEDADIGTGTFGNGENRFGYDKDFSVVCVNIMHQLHLRHQSLLLQQKTFWIWQ